MLLYLLCPNHTNKYRNISISMKKQSRLASYGLSLVQPILSAIYCYINAPKTRHRRIGLCQGIIFFQLAAFQLYYFQALSGPYLYLSLSFFCLSAP